VTARHSMPGPAAGPAAGRARTEADLPAANASGPDMAGRGDVRPEHRVPLVSGAVSATLTAWAPSRENEKAPDGWPGSARLRGVRVRADAGPGRRGRRGAERPRRAGHGIARTLRCRGVGAGVRLGPLRRRDRRALVQPRAGCWLPSGTSRWTRRSRCCAGMPAAIPPACVRLPRPWSVLGCGPDPAACTAMAKVLIQAIPGLNVFRVAAAGSVGLDYVTAEAISFGCG
jgi:hypothetical protein